MRKQPSTAAEPFHSGPGRAGRYPVLGGVLALSGAVAVALGAYAAHGMAARADEAAVAAVNTAVRYQMWHTLALLALLIWQRLEPAVNLRPVMVLWGLGVAAFSGSLYAMALGGLGVGLVTPLGGLALIAGWLTLGVTAWRADARWRQP